MAAGLVGHTLDIDKLLWVPGAKTFFLPSARQLLLHDIITDEVGKYYSQLDGSLFDRDEVFYHQLMRRGTEVISVREMRIPLKVRGDK